MAVNDTLLDAQTGHLVGLQRYSSGVVRRIIALLNRVDADLFAQLTAALERVPQNAVTVARIDELLASVREINAAAYAQVRDTLEGEVRDLAAYELQYQQRLFERVIPAAVTARYQVAAASVEQVYAAALSRPFQGRLLREWAQGIEADRMVRIRDAVRMGVVEGETIDQIVRRIRGTRTNGYADGLLEIDRRNAASVVRTAVAHTAHSARRQLYAANSDLIRGEVYTATLDGRTTPRCRALDGKVFALGDGPQPPLHWNCRSIRTPVLRSWRELGIDADELPAGTRASMDGQVPADTTYQEWLRRQSAEFQDDVLGPTRGKLFRRGGVTLDRFVNRDGDQLTLVQLRQRDEAAFERAGV